MHRESAQFIRECKEVGKDNEIITQDLPSIGVTLACIFLEILDSGVQAYKQRTDELTRQNRRQNRG